MKIAAIGTLRHYVTLENPATVPDGEGGYTQTWVPLNPPRMKAAIEPATARDLERAVSSTVLSTASHVVTMRYHSGVTTETRIRFGSRIFSVVGPQNISERNREMRLACEEVVT